MIGYIYSGKINRLTCLFSLMTLLSLYSCRTCKSVIPNHETLQLPEGLGVYYPGQQLLKGQAVNTLDDSRLNMFTAKKQSGGSYSTETLKAISGSVKARVKKVVQADLSRGILDSTNVSLNKLYKIVGAPDEVYYAQNEGTIIKNVLIADATIKVFSKDTTRATLDSIKIKLAADLNAKVVQARNSNSTFIANDIVVGLQTQKITNLGDLTSKSSKSFNIGDGPVRELVLIDPNKDFDRPSEVVLYFPARQAGEPANTRKIRIDVYGTGGVIQNTSTLDFNNLNPLSYVLPASGPKSRDKYVVYTFDPVQNPDGTCRVVVNRAMKKVEDGKSGLSVLCK